MIERLMETKKQLQQLPPPRLLIPWHLVMVSEGLSVPKQLTVAAGETASGLPAGDALTRRIRKHGGDAQVRGSHPLADFLVRCVEPG